MSKGAQGAIGRWVDVVCNVVIVVVAALLIFRGGNKHNSPLHLILVGIFSVLIGFGLYNLRHTDWKLLLSRSL